MHLRGIGYALMAALMFGLGVVLAKLVGTDIDATIVGVLALALGGLLLAGGLLLTGTALFKVLLILTRRDWIDLFLLACPGTSLPLLFIVAGFARTSALEGGFLLQLNGVAGLIFAVLLLGERIRLKQGLGIPLLLLGSLLVVFKGTQGVVWGNGGLGDLFILAGAIGLGFGFIPAKRLSERIDTLPLTAWRLLIGACTLLPILAVQWLTAPQPPLWHLSATVLWALPTYILTNFCLAYLAQQEGLRLLKAWEMAALMQTVPLFSTLFALLLLHDTMTLLQVGGALLALLGGLVVSLSNREPAPVIAGGPAPVQEELERR